MARSMTVGMVCVFGHWLCPSAQPEKVLCKYLSIVSVAKDAWGQSRMP